VKLFRRAWRVQVGSLDASTLACKFKVQRTLAMGRAGHAEIVIFGLTPEHRREIISAPRRRTFVELHAGYETGSRCSSAATCARPCRRATVPNGA